MTLNTPPIDWFGLSPVLTLIGTAFAALLCAVLVPRAVRRLAVAGIGIAGFTAGIVLAVWLYVDSANGHTIAAGAYYRDRWTSLGQIIIFAVGLATTVLAVEHAPGWGRDAELKAGDAGGGATGARPEERLARRDDHVAEFFALLLASAAGMAFFVGAANLITLFLSLEWFSIALYVMCAIDYDLEGSLEAGLKYLIVGSFGSAGLLFGMSGLLTAAYLTFERTFLHKPLSDRPLLQLAILLMLVGVQLVTMGLLGELTTRTYYEAQGSRFMSSGRRATDE